MIAILRQANVLWKNLLCRRCSIKPEKEDFLNKVTDIFASAYNEKSTLSAMIIRRRSH